MNTGNKSHVHLENAEGAATDGNNAVESVVGAADRLCGALVASEGENADGGAVESDRDAYTVEDTTSSDTAQETIVKTLVDGRGGISVISGLNRVAALLVLDVALVDRGSAGVGRESNGVGDEGSNSEEFCVHGDEGSFWESKERLRLGSCWRFRTEDLKQQRRDFYTSRQTKEPQIRV